MKTVSLFLSLIAFQFVGFAQICKAVDDRPHAFEKILPKKTPQRGIASIAPKNALAEESKMGQAEKMLRDVREPKPAFAHHKASPIHMVGICSTPFGAYHISSQDRRSYEDCMDSDAYHLAGYHVGGAGLVFSPVR